MRSSLAVVLLALAQLGCQSQTGMDCGPCPPRPVLPTGPAVPAVGAPAPASGPHANAQNLVATVGPGGKTLTITYRKDGHDLVETWAISP